MGRKLLVGLAAVVFLTGVASRASAQGMKDLRWNTYGGWGGSITESSHQDEGLFGLNRGVYSLGKGQLRVGAELRFGYEHDFGAEQKYLGVIQFRDSNTFKWPCYINVYAGLEHFSGESVFYMEPAAGMVFPWGFKDFKLYGQIGIPIHFFDGNTEAGFGGQVGFTLPFIK